MRLGVIARADRGGLASQTYEVWRHLQPDRVLIMDMGLRARGGETERGMYASDTCERFVHRYRRDGGGEIERFVYGLDVVWCADDETEVLSRRGWLRYDEVTTADEVLTLTPDHLSEWQPVLAVNVFEAKPRRMLSIESRGHSSLTTENHRWLVQHRLTGPKPHHCYTDYRVRTSEELRGADRIPRAAPCINMPTEAKFSDALVEIVAWFYTEGHVRGSQIGLSQSGSVNASNCAQIRGALMNLFGPGVEAFSRNGRNRSGIPAWREKAQGQMIEWYLNADAAEEVLAHAPAKIVSLDFIQALTRSQLNLFVNVSMLADNNGPRAFAQKDSARLDAFELACVLLGRGVSRRVEKIRRGHHGTTPLSSVSLYKSTYMHLDMARREWIAHEGIVWCPTTANGSWFARRRGTMYYTGNSAETVYGDTFYQLARSHRCLTVLQANPELFHDADRHATAIWLPTRWELQRLPKRAVVVPTPVALDRFEYRQRTSVNTLFATTGEAMEDRNGWEIVKAAMQFVERPMTLLWRGGLGPDIRTPEKIGEVKLEWLPPVADYADLIPPEVDLALMPRRYGGQALPVQEAAAQGIPTVMTDIMPQSDWGPSGPLIPARADRVVRMKGGDFTIFDADPAELAAVINHAADSPVWMEGLSAQARRWAEHRSWDVKLPEWRERLEELRPVR